MKRINEKGVTLVELIITISIMTIIAGAAIPLLSTSIDANNHGMARSRLYHEGLLAMERMTSGVRRCTHLAIPNSWLTTRDILAFSGTINEDDDYYFDDLLFPRIDEDVGGDINNDGMPGIAGIDDDGSGGADEGDSADDDESGWVDEDWLDGGDNDADGDIDDDLPSDMNADGESGIAGMDDDGDGLVDEEEQGDDDEDGVIDEDSFNETIYTYDNASNTLTESMPYTGESVVLSTHATFFQVTYEAPERILIELTLSGDKGESVQFAEYVYPRNTFQKTGKRVR